jgi:hypothetical protein
MPTQRKQTPEAWQQAEGEAEERERIMSAAIKLNMRVSITTQTTQERIEDLDPIEVQRVISSIERRIMDDPFIVRMSPHFLVFVEVEEVEEISEKGK